MLAVTEDLSNITDTNYEIPLLKHNAEEANIAAQANLAVPFLHVVVKLLHTCKY